MMWEKEWAKGCVVGDSLPGAPELADRGSWTAGVCTLRLTEKDQPMISAGMINGCYPRADRELTVEVWYPALGGREDSRTVYTDHMGRADLGNLTPFSMNGRSFRDAEPDRAAGARPVIVISHGYPGSRFLLLNLAENLASKGYVVLSIGHTDNTYEDFLPAGSMESALIHRSRDQRFVIGELKRMNEEGFLRGMLQPENVGLIGFSMGGYGALRTIGARWSEEALSSFSAIREELKDAKDYRGVKAVRAAALFAPATFWLDAARQRDVDIPTIWFCGTADHTVHYEMVHRFWETTEGSDRIFVSYTACGHNVANNPAPDHARGESWEIFKRWSDPVWDTWRLNNDNCHFLTAFFDLHLQGKTEMEKYLLDSRELENGQDLPGFVAGGSAGIRLEKKGIRTDQLP